LYWSLINNTSKHGGHTYDLLFVIVESPCPKMKLETFGDSQHLVVFVPNLDTNYWISLAHIALMGDDELHIQFCLRGIHCMCLFNEFLRC
jgi:hypothetical protein